MANANVYVLQQNDYSSASIFAVNEQVKLYFREETFNFAIAALDSEFLWWYLFLDVMANQERSYWALNQSDCEKVTLSTKKNIPWR